MKRIQRQVITNQVLHFYEENGMKETVRHFWAIGEKRNTIYSIINRFLRSGTSVFKPITGRKTSVATPGVQRSQT